MHIDTKKWKRRPFKPLIDGAGEKKLCIGSRTKAKSWKWCTTLSEAMGDLFREGLKITDYGCGKGRYCNFLTGWLREFTYYGLEPKNRGGRKYLGMARHLLGETRRWRFGFLGTKFEREALENSEIILLGSVFPHLAIEDFHSIMDDLLSAAPQATLIFSVMHATKYQLGERKGLYGNERCYEYVFYTVRQVRQYFDSHNIEAVVAGVYDMVRGFPHTIYRVNGRKA